MALRTAKPYTAPGDTKVSRMLIDTGVDILLIAEDLVPEAVERGQPVWVEGVDKQTQLYRTAKLYSSAQVDRSPEGQASQVVQVRANILEPGPKEPAREHSNDNVDKPGAKKVSVQENPYESN